MLWSRSRFETRHRGRSCQPRLRTPPPWHAGSSPHAVLDLLPGNGARRSRVSAGLVCCLTLGAVGALAEPPDDETARQQRLELMTRKLDSFVLSTDGARDTALPRTPAPVLRYSNAVRGAYGDGAVFLWLSGPRPVAAASLWLREEREVGCEFTTLSDRPLRCLRGQALVWAPHSGSLVNQPLPGALRAGESPETRLIQMRQTARRFSGQCYSRAADQWEELRLLPQPIHRFGDEDAGTLDGALFVLVQGNDPEILVLLEVLQSSGGDPPPWRYSLARVSSMQMKARLDGTEIWSVEGYWSRPRSVEDPYREIIEPRE